MRPARRPSPARKSLHKAVITTEDMAAAPSGQVYQLWLQQRGDMVSAGLMAGGGDEEIVLEGDAATASAVGVTVEPDGGSEEPNLPPVALFDFSEAT
ncbi:anti-sigma factor [Nocardioides sp. B-3]|uniref:anti-sigma factor n=1 Tax=Nocardioides sp. B-3 TaxID=2895565 RepID=UPI0021533BE8|nr:anti-sigma factor [Nocardioides sp. B-3]UUZ61274.1 anti-sigma factor [Nocardioides sp. B-3]